MMRRIFVLTVVFLTMSAPWAADTRFLQGLGAPLYQRIDSEIIGRPYHIYTMLPAGYEESPDRYYPTVYVLDGGALFPLLAAYYRYLNFGQEVPDLILVGISYGNDNFGEGNFRTTDYTAISDERDYWGGAGRFQRFLGDELFPQIEAVYRSRADRRVIFGQSIGGQFVLYTALTQPGLFWGHIASNPALHRNLPFFLKDHAKPANTGDRSRLFVASGSKDDATFRGPALQWIQHWSGKEDNPWQLKTMTLDGHSHMSAPPASFRQGMIWLFSSEQTPHIR